MLTAFLCTLLSAPSANALFITFTGTVDDTFGDGLGYQPGDAFSGYLEINLEALDPRLSDPACSTNDVFALDPGSGTCAYTGIGDAVVDSLFGAILLDGVPTDGGRRTAFDFVIASIGFPDVFIQNAYSVFSEDFTSTVSVSTQVRLFGDNILKLAENTTLELAATSGLASWRSLDQAGNGIQLNNVSWSVPTPSALSLLVVLGLLSLRNRNRESPTYSG